MLRHTLGRAIHFTTGTALGTVYSEPIKEKVKTYQSTPEYKFIEKKVKDFLFR